MQDTRVNAIVITIPTNILIFITHFPFTISTGCTQVWVWFEAPSDPTAWPSWTQIGLQRGITKVAMRRTSLVYTISHYPPSPYIILLLRWARQANHPTAFSQWVYNWMTGPSSMEREKPKKGQKGLQLLMLLTFFSKPPMYPNKYLGYIAPLRNCLEVAF